MQRADGSRVLDVRILFQTDGGEKIYVSWRGMVCEPTRNAGASRKLAGYD